MPQYALKFISGKYQGGEFPLLPDREIIIGRASDLGMVLVEDMVSRKHAKISTAGGDVIIQDLGSTNGTFVNGEKIRKTRLKEGDRILIGTSILKMLVTSKATDEHSAKASMQARDAGGAASSDMSGQLDEVPVPDLLQLFGTSKRTGVLTIQTSGHHGRIYLRDGNVFYALVDDNHELGPMKALARMISWPNGSFAFGPSNEATDFVIELEDSTEALIAEANRQIAEFARVSGDLPPMNTKIAITRPLDAPLSLLGPTELDVIQLVYNFGTVQTVLDNSAITDAETGQALLSLISQEYVSKL